MKSRGKPKVTKYTQKPYTKVSWVLDFELLWLNQLQRKNVSTN